MQEQKLDEETLGLLRESLARYGRERYGFEARRERLASATGFGHDVWNDYASLGWLAIPLAVDDGGFDGDARAMGALMGFVGEHLALEPIFASVVLCGRLLGLAGSDSIARGALAELAEGRTRFALAHAESTADGVRGDVAAQYRAGCLMGEKTIVLHGDSADAFLVSARDEEGRLGVFLAQAAAPGLSRTAYRLVDGRGAANVTFSGVAATRIAAGMDAADLLAHTLDDARLALCAEALGAGRALNAMTLAYLKERRQFGRPIGVNQALQHRMVTLHMLQEEGRAVINAAYRAAGTERRAAVLAATAHLMTLGREASHEAVQLHGGIGITEELAVSHYFRRIMVINRLLGDRAAHVREFAAIR